MALIGQIRKNSWLLIIFIGMGLALFIITSMFVGNQIPFLDSQNSAGSINGEEVNWTEFLTAEEAYRGSNDIYSTRNYIWNFFVEDAIIKKEADALGFAVGKDEQQEMFFGNNLHPKIRQFFTDPATGQVDRNQVNQAKTVLESGEPVNPRFLTSWNQQTKEAIKEQLQTRLNTLISKSIFTPTWMVEQSYTDQNQTATFEFVKIPYDEIDNSDVSVENSDLSAYLAENKAQFYQDEQTRKLDYIVYEVLPTASDSLSIKNELDDLAGRFKIAENDTTFVDANAGVMDPRFLSLEDTKKGQTALTSVLAEPLLEAEVGDVVGPIIDGNQMKIVKLLDRKVMPDSATSRHILINASTPQEFDLAATRIDSFKRVIESGAASFDSLAIKFSQDPGSASKGGLYENITPNTFVPEYNDIIFFSGDIGKLYAVRSTFGVHLIEPMSRKYADPDNKTARVKAAIISKPIIPSEVTQEAIGSAAQEFMANNRNMNDFAASAAEQGLKVETSTGLKSNDFVLGLLGSGNVSRDIIRWAFNSGTEVGSVAPEVYEYQDPVEYYTSKYVVTGLKLISDAGNPSVAAVDDEIRPIVLNQKKAEVIKSKISSQNLSSIASSFSTQVDTASTVTFNSNFIAQFGGSEPEVLATAFNLTPNTVSAPVAGNNGVYIIKLLEKNAPGSPTNIPTLRRQTSQSKQSQIASSLIQSMKKSAEIKDLRSKFY